MPREIRIKDIPITEVSIGQRIYLRIKRDIRKFEISKKKSKTSKFKQSKIEKQEIK
jgi:hypothetical protein